MSLTIKTAFADHALRAEFRGFPAKVLPLTPEITNRFEAGSLETAVGQGVVAGNLLVGWMEGAERRGMVLNPHAGNDLTLLFAQTDGADVRVPAGSLQRAAVRLYEMGHESVRNHLEVAEQNEKIRAEHLKALAKDPDAPEPELMEPRFPKDAFTRVPALIACVEAGIRSKLEDPFADITEKTEMYNARYELGRANANVLSAEQMSKVLEYRSLREQIGALQPGHVLALTPPDAPYEGDGEAARKLMSGLPGRRAGFSDRQLAALAGNLVISKEVFSVLTTTPISGLNAQMLAPQDHQMIAQEMARHEERVWSPGALNRISEVVNDRIPGYRFEARFFSKGDADLLLVRDHVGAFLYSWDSASRVAEVNVKDRVLSTYNLESVPSDDQLDAARAALQELRYDNGADIDFAFNDVIEPEEDEIGF